MTKQGEFYRTKRLDSLIGEECYFEPLSTNDNLFIKIIRSFQDYLSVKVLATVALILLLIIPTYAWMGSNEVYAYVNIDINPSIELSLNDSFEVIGIEGLNEDGQLLLSNLSDWKKKSLQNVSSKILLISQDMGYLQKNHNLLLGISYVGQNNESNHTIIYDVSDYLQSEFETINIASFEVPTNIREEAKLEKTSMNIIYASQLLNQGDHNFTSEQEDSDFNIEQNNDVNISKNRQLNHLREEQDETNPQYIKINEKNINKNNMKVIEKFLIEAKDRNIPPGIKKKIEQLQLTEEVIQEITDNKLDSIIDLSDSDLIIPANKKLNHTDNVYPGKSENGKNKGKKDQAKPGDKNRNKNENDEREFEEQRNLPPGLIDKGDDHPSRNGKHGN